MIREHKFRAWDKQDKVMRNDVHFDKTHIYYREKGAEKDSYMPIGISGILMQYIGLKDKNRVEIYCGDIVRGLDEQVFSIIFEDSSYKCKKGDWSWILDSKFFNLTELEVIGNIYLNKELLK